MKSKIFVGVMLAIVYGCVEMSSLLGLEVLRRFKYISYHPISKTSLANEHREILTTFLAGKNTYYELSADLGWTIKENGYADMYRANSHGIRADREYSSRPAEGKIRLATFGDSFTHSSHVRNEESWQEQLCELDSSLEVLNFGVGAYGVDQAYLRYLQDGLDFHADIVLIGFMSENIYRTVSVFRPFYSPGTGIPLAKPRFIIHDDSLALLPNPLSRPRDYRELLQNSESILRELGTHDYHFETSHASSRFDVLPSVRLFKVLQRQWWLSHSEQAVMQHGQYNPRSEAYRVTLRILQEFYEEVRRHDAVPVILIFPAKEDILLQRQGKTSRYAPLLDDLKISGIAHIDLIAPFAAGGDSLAVDEIFTRSAHYNGAGNQIIAKYIWQSLQQWGVMESRVGTGPDSSATAITSTDLSVK